MTVDHHTLAAIALTGTALNLLGGLYLAYDLFGGQHGPLRTLTRAVTYGVLFFVGYVILLPVGFSAPAALGTGCTLAIEFARAARGARPTRLVEALSSLARGACFGLGGVVVRLALWHVIRCAEHDRSNRRLSDGHDADARSRRPQAMAQTSARRGQSHDRLRG